jgi:serine/threonine protein kinase
MTRCQNCFEAYDNTYELCPHCGYTQGDAPKELYHLHPGMELAGRYLVGQVLGFGGFGTTYKVWDKNLHTVLAIKEYYPAGLVNRVPGTMDVTLYAGSRKQEYDHGLVRFLDEARSMAKFSTHRNIINIFEYFEENNTAYIVMEFLDGLTLGEFLKMDEMDIEACIDVTMQVSAALKDIHAAGIVHRDVSPDNIFLCNGGVIKLIDFGAARFSLDEDRQMTIILKPGFAPPEQYEKINEQGPWTDIYALGATLYYMVTGVKPEESTNRRIKDELVPPHELDEAIPEFVSNTILKAMAIDRHMRFASVSEFEKALQHEKKVLPPKMELKRRKQKRLIGVLAAVLVLAIGGGLFGANYHEEKEAETLPDCQLVLWLPETRQTAFEEIIKAFNVSFPNVEIELKPIAAEQYAAELTQTQPLPNLFDSTGLPEPMLTNAQDLSGLLNVLDLKRYYALSKFEAKNQLPLGMIAPVIYVNNTLASPEDVDAIQASTATDRQAFFDGKAATWLASTAEYAAVQAALPGRYELLPAQGGAAQFSDLWSIGNCDKDQLKAAQRLLEFFLSDNAQDHLFIQQRSGAVPLNKQVLQEYCAVYSDFDGFFTSIDKYTFE